MFVFKATAMPENRMDRKGISPINKYGQRDHKEPLFAIQRTNMIAYCKN